MVESPLTLAWLESPVGTLAAGATSEALVLLEYIDDMPHAEVTAALELRFGKSIKEGKNPHLKLLRKELAAYFAGTLTEFTVPLSYPGSKFQEQVWGELLKIPYGETRSYQNIADALGISSATRAVGTANGQNRIAIVIPCHRVVNTGGALGGYSGGLWRKRHLLDLEHGQRGLGI